MRTLQAIGTTLLLAFSCVSIAHAQSKPLERISKVTSLIDYSSTGQAPVGLSEERLRTVLELKLRSAGLRVLTVDEDRTDPDLNPYIYLDVSTLQTRNRSGDVIGWTYAVRLSARLFGTVPINKARAPMELWADSTMRVSSKETASSETERAVVSLCESFLNAWLAANPRR